MAIMSRGKKAVAQGWNAVNKQRDEQTKKGSEEFKENSKKEITEEEHEKRLEKLKEIGLLK